jgi:hypothetical protein
MKHALILTAFACAALAQTATPAAPAAPATVPPTYFSTTGCRYDYYDKILTETTNLGVRVAASSSASQDVPAGLWVVTSIDATPRSQASSAALRIGARYYIKSIASGNVIVHSEIQEGATVTTTSAAASALSGSTTSILNNLSGGLGFTWRACHTIDPKSKINCVADFVYDINAVSSQAVKPVVGFFIGIAF